MNFASVEKIARAVLYEGYILYPYRPSSTKNRQRWNFGTLYPREWAQAQRPAEPFQMVTECVFQGNPGTRISARVRCLQFVPSSEGWEQGVERWADLTSLALPQSGGTPYRCELSLQQAQEYPGLRLLSGALSLSVEENSPAFFKLRLELLNTTPAPNSATSPRTEMLLQSMVSAHLLIGIENGEFVSSLDPPQAAREAVSSCRNTGAFPVLAGDENQRSLMLASPIILYDYPQIAPESAGDFFDGTEMDEMLALRVMTLTEEEKQAARQSDQQARQILDRTDNLPQEHWMKIHGAIRGMRRVPREEAENMGDWDPLAEKLAPESVTIFGVELRKGSRVRLWPQKTADIMDMALKGKVAIIEAIEQDFEDQVHLAVVVEDDPGREFGMMRQPGHRFFFSPEEVEPLEDEVA